MNLTKMPKFLRVLTVVIGIFAIISASILVMAKDRKQMLIHTKFKTDELT